MKKLLEKYKTYFSEDGFWVKMKNYARQARVKTVYTALLLFYAYKRKETPSWAKNIIIGVIGYFITPIDIIPDLTPIIGYTDDIGMLGFGLVTIACYIDKEVKQKARAKLTKWFGEYDERELVEIDKQL